MLLHNLYANLQAPGLGALHLPDPPDAVSPPAAAVLQHHPRLRHGAAVLRQREDRQLQVVIPYRVQG